MGFRQAARISIHLMFLLITSWETGAKTTKKYFNTSHVSINQHRPRVGIGAERDFNTSHVSINLCRKGFYARVLFISIHLMFLLIGYDVRIRAFPESISIHLMFLLIVICFWSVLSAWLYFNTSHVSINLVMDGDMDMDVVFQYISCFY